MPELRINNDRYHIVKTVIARVSLNTCDKKHEAIYEAEASCRPEEFNLERAEKAAFAVIMKDLRRDYPGLGDDMNLDARERSRSNRQQLWEKFRAAQIRREREELLKLWPKVRPAFPRRWDWNRFYAFTTGQKFKKRKKQKSVSPGRSGTWIFSPTSESAAALDAASTTKQLEAQAE